MQQCVCERDMASLYDDEIVQTLMAEGCRSPRRGIEVLPAPFAASGFGTAYRPHGGEPAG